MRTDLADGGGASAIVDKTLGFLTRAGTVWQPFLCRVSRIGGCAWPLTIGVALIYTVCFASFIDRHTSLPFWDGHAYVTKTSRLAEKFERAAFFERLNPALYLKENPTKSPPLLMAAAAIILGPKPRKCGDSIRLADSSGGSDSPDSVSLEP